MTVPQPWQPWQPPPPPHRRTGTALALAIIALGGGIFVLPLALGPIAWWFGVTVMRDMDREPHRWSGRGSARGAAVMGGIATVLLVVVTMFALLMLSGVLLLSDYDSGY